MTFPKLPKRQLPQPRKSPKMTHHKIIIGDSRKMLKVVDNSIHLIVTSPPYWQLKDYGVEEQIGYHDSYEEYIGNLNLVWDECYRVLHPGCRMCINIGDQFARSVFYGRYKVIPIRTEIIKYCESIGLDYMGAIIWQKATTCHTTGGATVMGSYPYPRSGIIKIDYEFILIFKKLGRAPRVSKEIKEQSKLTDEEWNEYFYGHWNFSGEKQDKHLAAFPEELPKRLIKMFSFVGDTVLDPFLGSGTTSVAAMKLDRNSIGYEINEDYIGIINKRLTENIGLFEQGAEFEIIKQREDIDLGKQIQKPYIFKAPLERKVDPKLLRFGSKIDGSEKEAERYYTVKKVLSPSELLLDTGAEIHLLGVKANDETYMEAIRFLQNLTKGQKVFLRFDEIKYDENNHLLCYLYLRNKTFVNAHLIKNNLADVDTTYDYKYKSRFLAYERRSKDGRDSMGL
jgi:site-specific DNA-methyltransferase (adenine-specific)